MKIDLSKLYENLDIAETLSNLAEKWIKKMTPHQVSPATPLQEGNHRIDISNLPIGLYFIQIGDYSEKFVVVR